MANQTCCFKGCGKNVADEEGRTEVKTVLPKKGFTKLKPKLLIDWNKKGEAVFHTQCWDSLLKSVRAKNKKNIVFNQILPSEKALIKEAAKTCERHDAESVFINEGQRIAQLIKRSKGCVCFTGAGISTSAGIGDYRGKSGKWTEMDREKLNVDDLLDEPATKKMKVETQEESDEDDDSNEYGVPYEKLRPTYTHEALAKLMEDGHLKYCISQNGDGLHLLSGIPMDNISELHGNVFIEKCEKCEHRYERPFYVMDDLGSQYFEEKEDSGKTDIKKPMHAKQCDLCGLSHRTGRKCDQKNSSGKVCGGYLIDTIINFRDLLEGSIMDRAYKYAWDCDLMLCLGTTLTVTPANELVEVGKQPLQIVICNRQKTHMDSQATVKDKRNGGLLGSHVFGDCDRLMRSVMRNLYSKKDIERWEADRCKRMEVYDEKRIEK